MTYTHSREEIEELSKALEAGMNFGKSRAKKIFMRVVPQKVFDVDWEEKARWIGARLPEKARRWLRTVAGEPQVLTRGSLLKSAEEMFVRDLLTKRELLHFEANLGSGRFDPTTMNRVVTFIKSGEWMESTPEWDKKRAELTSGYSHYSHRRATIPVVSARTAPPRTVPLKGSKAVEQQEQGYGPGGARRSRPGYQELLTDIAIQTFSLEKTEDDDYLDSSIQRAESLLDNLIEIWLELQQRKDAQRGLNNG